MEKKESPNFSSTHQVNKSSPEHDDELQELLQTLEQQTNWDGRRLVKYDGSWCDLRVLRPILSARKHFNAENSDVILASFPKSGTTWLKALTFSILNRDVYAMDQTPLLTSFPHTLVPFLEFDLFLVQENPDLNHLPSPRILSTHVAFKTLPESIRDSGCKIIYTSRNPLDQFISHRQFMLENKIQNGEVVPVNIDEAFDMFCRGIYPCGPFWDHMLGYWNAHLENPEKVLFLKYEDLKEDVAFYIKKIAEFLGCPFSMDEERQGVVGEIARLCSFENLKNLEVNKTGDRHGGLLKNSSYFRKGQVGDWTNHLTPAMAERFKKIMESKFEGSGLMFNI